MHNVNILLVDDQPGKLLSYQAILSDLGGNLVTAKSGREALQYLLHHECALILLDVVMPEMDGFETATLIRQRPRLEQTPIIFLTSYSASDLDRLKGYQLGAVDFVYAPVVPEILRAKVLVFMEQFRNRRELAKAVEQLRAEIAERKRAQEHALQAERLAAVGQVVTGLAHESRNALQQIQACVEMLARRIQAPFEASLIGELQKAHDRIHRLLEAVRDYAGPLQLSCDVHDLALLWREAWNQLLPLRKGRDAVLQEDIGPADLCFGVDPFAMAQVFRNIFENSLAACTDPVTMTIVCTATELNGQAAIRVRLADNGPGLTAEQRQHIFEPFFTTKTRGTGLGMAIARRVVQAHGGQIEVADVGGPGAAIDMILSRGQS